MSNSQPSVQNRRFLAAASLIIVLTAGLAASAWPAVLSYGREQSARLVTAGHRAAGDEARLYARLAYVLDPGNPAAALSEATAKLAVGEPAAALRTLDRARQFDASLNQAANHVRLKAALESGDIGLAVLTADRILDGRDSRLGLVLAALAYGVAGKPERIEALKARVTSPEVLQSVLRAGGSKLTLAVELRATGLPVSSRIILEQAEVSVPRNLLLASLIKGEGRDSDLPKLAKLYREAITIDPSGTAARAGLIGVLRAQKDDSAADTQQKLLNRLQAGRP